MADDTGQSFDRVSRRRFAALAAATGASALAGCSALGDRLGEDGDDEPEHRLEDPETGATVTFDRAVAPRTTLAAAVRDGDDERVDGVPVHVDGTRVAATDDDGRVEVEPPFEASFALRIERDDGSNGSEDSNDAEDPLFDRSIPVEPPVVGDDYAFQWFDVLQREHALADLQYNPHVEDGLAQSAAGLFAPYAEFDRERAAFVPHLVREWTHEDGAMVAQLREDVTWETGEPVDAEAIAFQWSILLESDHPGAEFLTDVEATDEYEVAFRYEPGTNRELVEHVVLHERADHAPADWQPVRDGDVAPAEHAVETPTASGPLALAERTDEYHEYVVRNHVEDYADHPLGERYDWNGYRLRHDAARQSIHERVGDSDADAFRSAFFEPAHLTDAPRSVSEFRAPTATGLGLWFHQDGPFADRALRRAFAHSVDLGAVHDRIEIPKIGHEVQTGVPEPVVEDWLGDRDAFERYERDPERAAELAAAAGHDLGEVEPEILVPVQRSDWVLQAAVLVEQLNDAGWAAQLETQSREVYRGTRDTGWYDVVALPYGGGPRQFHPYFALRHQLAGVDRTPPEIVGYADGEAPVVEVGGETVDVGAELDALATTQDEAEQRQHVRRLALVVNRDLPYLHVAQRYDHTFVDGADWTLPDESPHRSVRSPLWWLPRADASLDDAEAPGLLTSRVEDDAQE